MKHAFRWALLTGFAFLLAAIPALAHHSFAAEFDSQKTVTVQGVFTKIDWINPHIYFYVEAKDGTEWAMEAKPTGYFHRAGVPRDTFKIGDPITAVLYRAKDGTKNFGYLKEMTFPSGRKIEFDNGRAPSN